MANPLQELIPDFVIAETTYPSLASSKIVAKQDATRWSILFGLANTSAPVNITTLSPAGIGVGFVLGTTILIWAMNFRDFGALVCSQFSAFQTNAGASLTVIETFYRPPGWEESSVGLLDELAARYAKIKWPQGS